MAACTVLAIETSCDDTSVAIVDSTGFVTKCISANQDMAHRPFGGVVPELASRNHTLQILPLIEELFTQGKCNWDSIDGIAVTSRPGLIGSLLVGVVTAKTLAAVKEKPFVGVNHLEAHLFAPFLYDNELSQNHELKFPFLALAISGGHTQLYRVEEFGKSFVLGRTIDDAAGEAFDKFAKHLGLGFPGGVLIDREAQKNGDPAFYKIPRTMLKDESLNFSFSGIKSAAIRLVDSLSDEEKLSHRHHLCASFQEAIVDTLMNRLNQAALTQNLKQVVLTGGVSANSRLRSVAQSWAQKNGLQIFIPPVRYCTDNAAMVGYVGAQRLLRGESHSHELAPSASSFPSDFL